LSVRVKVHFPGGEPGGWLDDTGGWNPGLLIFGDNEGRLENIHHYYNLDYRVRPRIEDVEEFGE